MERVAPVIAIKAAGAGKRAVFDDGAKLTGILALGDDVDGNEEVQVSIVIVVEKCGHGGMGGIREAVFRRHFFEVRDAVLIGTLVDIKQVFAMGRVAPNGGTDIDIWSAVVIDVDYRYAA